MKKQIEDEKSPTTTSFLVIPPFPLYHDASIFLFLQDISILSAFQLDTRRLVFFTRIILEWRECFSNYLPLRFSSSCWVLRAFKTFLRYSVQVKLVFLLRKLSFFPLRMKWNSWMLQISGFLWNSLLLRFFFFILIRVPFSLPKTIYLC